MAKWLILVSFLVLIIFGANVSANNAKTPENMDIKIKNIAANIVDKWKAEGLKITKEKVEGWLDIVDKSQQEHKKAVKPKQEVEKGKEYQEVKDTLVKTFSNIGKAKCENCNKPKHVSKDAQLEHLSVEELKKKQQAIINLQKLAGVADSLGNFAQAFKKLSTPREEL